MIPENDPYSRRFEHLRKRDEFLRNFQRQKAGIAAMGDGMFALLAGKGHNLRQVAREELPSACANHSPARLPVQMDYVHREARIGGGYAISSSEVIMIYDDNRQLFVHPIEIHKPKEPSRFLVVIPGFVVNYNYRTDEEGNSVSRIEPVSEDNKEAVRAFIKREGLWGEVCFPYHRKQ